MDKPSFFKKHIKIIVIILLLIISIYLSTNLSVTREKYFPVNTDRSIGMQLFGDMIGEVRTILASYILIQADLYHHERMARIAWNEDPATLPLHRFVTALDPKKYQAYDFGAYQLAVNLKKPEKGIEFLQEGLKYNPDNFELHHTMGEIYYITENFDEAQVWYKKALNLATDPVDMMNSLRRLYWTNRNQKNYEEAEKYINMWYNLSPADPTVRRMKQELRELKNGTKNEEDFEKLKPGKSTDTEKPDKNKEKAHKHDHRHRH